jgi:geranylgeranyl pyrophosphate synthase
MLAHAESAHIDALDRYGLHAGIAFQIVDDLLDLSGSEIQTGKTAQCDLNTSKLTLAIIHLLRTVDASEKDKVYRMLSHPGESRDELDAMLERHGSLDYAHERARRYVRKATDALATLPAGEARDALAEIAYFVAHRAA